MATSWIWGFEVSFFSSLNLRRFDWKAVLALNGTWRYRGRNPFLDFMSLKVDLLNIKSRAVFYILELNHAWTFCTHAGVFIFGSISAVDDLWILSSCPNKGTWMASVLWIRLRYFCRMFLLARIESNYGFSAYFFNQRPSLLFKLDSSRGRMQPEISMSSLLDFELHSVSSSLLKDWCRLNQVISKYLFRKFMVLLKPIIRWYYPRSDERTMMPCKVSLLMHLSMKKDTIKQMHEKLTACILVVVFSTGVRKYLHLHHPIIH